MKNNIQADTILRRQILWAVGHRIQILAGPRSSAILMSLVYSINKHQMKVPPWYRVGIEGLPGAKMDGCLM